MLLLQKKIEAKKQRARYVPDEILKLPTRKLLIYFLESPAVYACYAVSSPVFISQVDYNSMAFDELITREDLAEVVSEYGKELQSREKTAENETAIGFFNAFVVNKDVAPILNKSESLDGTTSQTRAGEPTFFKIGDIWI